MLRNNPSPESYNVGELFKLFSNHALMAVLDLVTMMVVDVGQPYATNEPVLAVSQNSYVPGEIVSTLKDYDDLRNIIQIIFCRWKSYSASF